MTRRRDAALFLLATLPRLLYLLIWRPAFEGRYWALSTSLLRDGSLGFDGIKSTEFEPGYPLFLALARILANDHVVLVQTLQIGISALGANLLYRLTERLTGRSEIAAVGVVLYAGDLLLIKQAVGQSPFVIVTTLVIAFAYCFLTATTTERAAGVGAILGLLVLTRMMTLPLVAGAAVLFVADRRLGAAIAATLAATLVILPMPLRNRGVNGAWWPTRSGLNLFIGNSPYTAGLVPRYDVDLLQGIAEDSVTGSIRGVPDDSPESSRVLDSRLTRQAWAFISDHPVRTVRSKAWNLFYYFWPPLVPYYLAGPRTSVVLGPNGQVTVMDSIPRPRLEVVAYSAWYSFVLGSAMMGVFLRRRILGCDAVLWLIVITFAGVHTVYFSATRYRAPIMCVVIFYASVALDRCLHLERWRPSRRES